MVPRVFGKRNRSFHVEADGRGKNVSTYKICLAGNPNSCLIKVEKQKFRALVDSGADISLIRRDVYDSLRRKPKLIRQHTNVQSVNGDPLKIDGYIYLKFVIGGTTMTQRFYVSRNMNRKVILGNDWLTENGVRTYHDLGCLRVNGTYVPLQMDIHVTSTLRAKNKFLMKPQTTIICQCKARSTPDLPEKQLYQIAPTEIGFLSNKPGVMVSNSIAKLGKNRNIPVMIVNNTNKTYKIRKGCVLAKLEKIEDEPVMSLNEVVKQDRKVQPLSFEEINVPEQYADKIKEVLTRNSDIFAEKDSELGHTNATKMKIDTSDHPPIKLRPYRAPLNNRRVIDEAIDEMLSAKVIERSSSPWSFPVVIVDKKDGSKRFCVDFRKLNAITKPISYPLPLIDDILAQLGQAKYFTSLDLKSGYWQVLMDENDKEKTAFACHRGLFQFNVMPFGLTAAPAIFQELMSKVLEGLDHFATAYLDDILIYSSTLEEHLRHIQEVFDRLRQHCLKLKLKKCCFMRAETSYLGFVISENGIKPDSKKVEVIQALPPPTCVREVRSFIGMCSYYRRFIPEFSSIAEPIIALTRKYARFHWDARCQKAFDFLKGQLSSIPMLAYPDTTKPYVLYTDASDLCIGACLTQPCDENIEEIRGLKNEKPIFYLSHRLSKSQVKWSTIEKEAYAIHFALQKLDHYLHNSEFIIRTDHKPLKYMLESPMQNKKIQLWALGISGYNCRVEYIEGSSNSCADMLSRVPENGTTIKDEGLDEPDVSDNAYEINALNSNCFRPRDFAVSKAPLPKEIGKAELDPDIDIVQEQAKDEAIVAIMKTLKKDEVPSSIEKRHIVIDGVLYYISNVDDDPALRLYIPENLKGNVVTQYHDHNGHMGIDKTFETIKQKYYWPNMYKELYAYVEKCITCQARNMRKIKAPVQETGIPPYPFAKIGLDLSGPYPTSLSGNKYIIAFIDLYSGYPEAFPVPDKSADNVVHLLIEEIFPRHGAVLEIVTDNGGENVNRKMQETLQALNINHVTTSFYHPQGNAKVERFHRTLHDVLSKKLKDIVQTWDLHLNQTLAAIRFNVSESTKFSPFFLLYARDVVLPLDNILKPRRKYMGEDMHQIALEQQHKAFTLVHKHLRRSKKRQAKYANKHAQNIEYNVGDPVFYKNFVVGKLEGKRWYPYYRIIKKTSPVNFVIRNQLDGTTVDVHAENIRLAHIDEWPLPEADTERPVRRTAFVVPPTDSSSDSNDESSGEESPTDKIAKRNRGERTESEDEDDIPLMELSKRIKKQKIRENIGGKRSLPASISSQEESDISDSRISDKEEDSISNQEDQENPEEMLIDEVHASPLENFISQAGSLKHKDTSRKVINLLTAVVDML